MPDALMDINASLVDQQVKGLLSDRQDLFPAGNDENKRKSAAFVALCMKTALDISIDEAAGLLTDGGNDFGVDGLYVADADDGEFEVDIFQGKYRPEKLDGTSFFPGNAVEKSVSTVLTLFDPYKHVTLNDALRPRIEDVRSRIRDGLIPSVRVVLCNNGARWNKEAQEIIDASGLPTNQVEFVHFNHDNIVEVMRKSKKIDDVLKLRGKVVVEDFNFKRVLVGKIPVSEVADLFARQGKFLLERNVRRYLGLHSNRVNSAIAETLLSDEKRDDFYFLNNGITIVCDKFSYNALQSESYEVQVSGMQVVNGGQTCRTIELTLNEHPELKAKIQNVFVLVRLYEIAANDDKFVERITFATNSQNPVDLRDLHSNDDIQKALAIGILSLGYAYRHKRDDTSSSSKTIHSTIVAESVLAIWRQKPHQARFMRREHFGKLYDLIFSSLNAAQAVVAALVFRFVENERKRPSLADYRFLPYSGHYVSMRLGILLLKGCNLSYAALDHNSFERVMAYFESNREQLYKQAAADVNQVLAELYGGREDLSLQQLAATFRRGDLIEKLVQA